MPLRTLLTLGVLALACVALAKRPAPSTETRSLQLAVEVSSVRMELAFDYSVMQRGPKVQKPAPTTWSSRLNVRWEARFGGEGRYIA